MSELSEPKIREVSCQSAEEWEKNFVDALMGLESVKDMDDDARQLFGFAVKQGEETVVYTIPAFAYSQYLSQVFSSGKTDFLNG
jgi:hypothetical protein